MTMARVNLWGRQIGAVGLGAERSRCIFKLPMFCKLGLKFPPTIAPRAGPYSFRIAGSFRGLPGYWAVVCPIKFGHVVIRCLACTLGDCGS